MYTHKLSLLILLFSVITSPAHATADGPDYFKIVDVAPDDSLSVRTGPGPGNDKIGAIPHNITCLKNLGCQGGLSLQEHMSLSEKEREKHLRENPRWCEIQYQGISGWVAGRFLAEDSCVNAGSEAKPSSDVMLEPDMAAAKAIIYPGENIEKVDMPPIAQKTYQGTIKSSSEGQEVVVYVINLKEKQRLKVNMESKSPYAYFNIHDVSSGNGPAVFGGLLNDSSQAFIEAEKPATYLIRPFLVRAAARKGKSANYTLEISRE